MAFNSRGECLRTLIASLVLANLAFAAWALLSRSAGRGTCGARYQSPAKDCCWPVSRRRVPRLPVPQRIFPQATASAAAPAVAPLTAAHCVTVGPFNDLAIAASASALLQSRGFTPTQRDEPGQDLIAYWVYLDNVSSDAAATRLLQKLHASGVADAHVMPVAGPAEPRRVSVGLFTEHGGAERRARQVRALGFAPVITEQHQPQATYWVDISLTSPRTERFDARVAAGGCRGRAS